MSIIKIAGLNEWVDLSLFRENRSIAENCTAENIQKYLDEKVKVKDLTVSRAAVVTDGRWSAPTLMGDYIPAPTYEGLPAFCDVEIAHVTGRHTENINVWVPLRWNERFLGVQGGGNRTTSWMPEAMATGMRTLSMPAALRNGYACSCTDGACRAAEMFGWGVDYEKKELDLEMYFNWIDYSTHVAAVVGKAVTECLCGMAPKYSYTMGASGGGRQVAYAAQKFPQDYDGYWADCPVLSYQKMLPALAWPGVVMNEYHDALPTEKYEAFRAAVWEKAGGREKFYNTTERVDFDPFTIVGRETPAGVITETDATVMQKIWEGPRSSEGEFLWYGMRPGVSGWSSPFGYAATVKQEDGSTAPVPFSLTVEYMRDWIMMDKSWDFNTLTIEGYNRMHQESCSKFSSMDLDNPDLRNLRDLGGKIIICHGIDDCAIYVDGTIDYYEKIIRTVGGKERTKEFARLLIVPGDDHGNYSKFGHGPSNATAMAALTAWVEEGIAPDTIHGQRFDLSTMTIAEEGDTAVY